MTSIKTKVEIQREKKTKIRGEFVDLFQALGHCEAEVSEWNGQCIFIFTGKADVAVKDRIKWESRIYDVSHISLSQSTEFDINSDSVNLVTVTGVLNEFESEIQSLIDLGCDVKYGFIEATGRDHDAEDFMDAWVGTYIKNIVDHYAEIKSGRHVGALFNLFNRDVPVACVGAGPSLDKNCALLKQFPGLIIATDKSYKMLLARNIDPDLVVSVDCHYDLIAEMLKYSGSARHRLVLNTCADPAVARIWKGKIFWFLMQHPGVQFTDKILPALFPTFEGIENLGNIGNTTVMLAEKMGCGPIYLVGHDYAYTGDRMHAQRYEFDEEGHGPFKIDDDHAARLKERTGQLEIDGIKTYAPFTVYRDTLYALREKRGINVINCTEGGILTQLPCRPLDEVIQELKLKSCDIEAARGRLWTA